MSKLLKMSILVVCLLACSASGYYVGRKTAPRAYVLDPATGNFVPLVVADGTSLFVASPDGIEPGVLAGHSKDGKKVLILPPSLLGDSGPQQQSAPHHDQIPQDKGVDRTSAIL